MGNTWSRVVAVAALLVTVSLGVQARLKLPKTEVKAWSFRRVVSVADTVSADSSYLNFPMRNVLYDYSDLNLTNGNLVSPVQSALYFYRTRNTDCLFATPYEPYLTTPEQVRFHRTTTPYSAISYKRGFTTYHEEHDLHFDFTGNLSPKTNLGAVINYLDAAGHYKSQAGKTVNGSVFGSYTGTHYSLNGAFTFNQLSNFENGGLSSPTDLQNRNMTGEDMPVNLSGMSGFRYLSGYLNHAYSVTAMTADSVEIPLLTFRHVFSLTDADKRYRETTAEQGFYPSVYLNEHATRDTAATMTISNTLAVTFEEAFNRHLRFGITAWVRDEAQRHINNRMLLAPMGQSMADPTIALGAQLQPAQNKNPQQHWSNNLFVGGALHKQTGSFVRYMADGEVCLAGRKLGEFTVNGKVDVGFRVGRDSLIVRADAFFRNETPDYFLQHYCSNHYVWDNDFKKLYRFRVGGEVAYPTQWFQPALRVHYETVKNLIYFAGLGGPQQTDATISVLAADLTANLTTPWVNLDNHVVYQYSSSSLIALPAITLYHNLYYHGTWFKALDAQIGVDLSYNTAFFAPLLNPALGQFAVQTNGKVGNYPRMNVYANFFVRRLRLNFFAQYQHFNATFMNRQYYAMFGYPTNPDVFRAGLAFRFYN